MAYIRSQLCCVFVSVFVALFCVDLAYRVEGDVTLRLANIGDNITLSCYRSILVYYNDKNWYRNGTLIANRDGVVINDHRFTQADTYDGNPDSNNIHISNVRMNDSATFQCRNVHDREIRSYDLRVIKCSNCIIATRSHPDKLNMICTLDNYWTRQVLFEYIILEGKKYRKAAIIEGNIFSFFITMTELTTLPSEFYLLIETETRITCMLPTQPTPPSFPATSLSTTSLSLRQTSQNRPSTLSYTAHTSVNKNASSVKNTRDSNITLIIVILGSVFILVLIVIIVLRCKKTKDRQENVYIGNASIEKEHSEVCYESVEDGPRKGPGCATSFKELRVTTLDQRNADHPENGEMIDNILYDSRDEIADSSISRMKGQLDDALYAMPDKRATISRESKSTSKATDRSSNSDHRYGNNSIITQHELNRDSLQPGEQYENVKMPGSGDDAEEIPLYNMPDEGPTRNTLKTTPEAGQTPTLPKNEVVSVDALYAEID